MIQTINNDKITKCQLNISHFGELFHKNLFVDSQIYFVGLNQFRFEIHVVVQDVDGEILHHQLNVRDKVADEDRLIGVLCIASWADLWALDDFLVIVKDSSGEWNLKCWLRVKQIQTKNLLKSYLLPIQLLVILLKVFL